MNAPQSGDVTYLWQERFYSTPGVGYTRRPNAPPHGCRPFVCVHVDASAGTSIWIALTKNPMTGKGKVPRLEIPREHKRPELVEDSDWLEVPTYIDDPAFLWTLTNDALNDLDGRQDSTRFGVSEEMLAKILIEVNSPRHVSRRSGRTATVDVS